MPPPLPLPRPLRVPLDPRPLSPLSPRPPPERLPESISTGDVERGSMLVEGADAVSVVVDVVVVDTDAGWDVDVEKDSRRRILKED